MGMEVWRHMKKWWRRYRMRFFVRGSLYGAIDLNARTLAARFGLDVNVVHKFCGNLRTLNGCHYQRLYNTPGIDYAAVGQYPGRCLFPRADGTPNSLKQHSALLPKPKG